MTSHLDGDEFFLAGFSVMGSAACVTLLKPWHKLRMRATGVRMREGRTDRTLTSHCYLHSPSLHSQFKVTNLQLPAALESV